MLSYFRRRGIVCKVGTAIGPNDIDSTYVMLLDESDVTALLLVFGDLRVTENEPMYNRLNTFRRIFRWFYR